MISIMHMPWIGRELEVIGSFDPHMLVVKD